MIISKKKYEAAIKEAVDKAMGEFWREREYSDQRMSFRADLNRVYEEISRLRKEIAKTAADLSRSLSIPSVCNDEPTCRSY